MVVNSCSLFCVRSLLAAFFLAVSFSCSLVYTSPYDINIDKALTKLQKQTAEFFVAAFNPADCEYDDHLEFYQKSRVALSGLQVRARLWSITL